MNYFAGFIIFYMSFVRFSFSQDTIKNGTYRSTITTENPYYLETPKKLLSPLEKDIENYNYFDNPYYPISDSPSKYLKYVESFDSCLTKTKGIIKKRINSSENYKYALSYINKDLVYVHITGPKTHYPFTPCRIIADTTRNYGYYLVTLEELNEKGISNKCKNIWRPPLDNVKNFKLYRKECFDKVVNLYLKSLPKKNEF